MAKKVFVAISVVLLFSTFVAASAPEPAAVSRPGDWTLRSSFEHLQPIRIRTSEDQPSRYWYLILTVTNETDRDVDFDTSFALMTDTFEVTPAGKNVPSAVYDRIKQRYRRRYPLLMTVPEAGSRILQGQDNAKDILVVWPEFDNDARSLSVFITGLSNETAVVEHPHEKDEQENPVRIYLRKTLVLNYDISGDVAINRRIRLNYDGMDWVMR